MFAVLPNVWTDDLKVDLIMAQQDKNPGRLSGVSLQRLKSHSYQWGLRTESQRVCRDEF